MAKTATVPKRKSGSPRRPDAERAAWDAILPNLEVREPLDLPEADEWLMETHYPVI